MYLLFGKNNCILGHGKMWHGTGYQAGRNYFDAHKTGLALPIKTAGS